jgi:pectinesterase
MKIGLVIIMVHLFVTISHGQIKPDIIVAADGTGDFTTLTDAMAELPYYKYQRYVIFVKNGVYNEKIRIEKDYLTIQGESRDSTIIEFSQLREDWIANKDIIGPAVINIHADDIILDNLTIRNTQPEVGPHAFAILGTGTRTVITNCNVTSNGGDTVSLWNYKQGMYYHDNCYFEGAVDFVCPRGWCYISNSTFKELKNTAAVWHAAPHEQDQKFVLEKCTFQGVDSFYLARHHYDAQFFFLDCTFPGLMMDKPVEHVVYKDQPEKTRPYLYGDRYYFDNCHRIGGDYAWFKDNLKASGFKRSAIVPAWTFDEQWNPIDASSLKIIRTEVDGASLFLWFDDLVMPEGELVLKLSSGKIVKYFSGGGWKRLELRGDNQLMESDLKGELKVLTGNIKNVKASAVTRYCFKK